MDKYYKNIIEQFYENYSIFKTGLLILLKIFLALYSLAGIFIIPIIFAMFQLHCNIIIIAFVLLGWTITESLALGYSIQKGLFRGIIF